MWRVAQSAFASVISTVFCSLCILPSALAAKDHLNNHSVKIMPLGDSITEGYSARDSYRWHLWRLIQQRAFDVDFVGSVNSQARAQHEFDADHEGHWGFSTTEILNGLPSWLSENTPDIVLLHIGTNDVGTCRSPIETAETIKRVIHLIRERKPNAIIILAKIIPIDFDGHCSGGRSLDESVRQLNQRLEAIFTDNPNIVILDLYSTLDAKTDLRDALHPNDQGFEKMAEAWFQALKPILAVPR